MRNERLAYLKQEVKFRLDIEDVVSSYLPIDRAGKGICPFHGDTRKGSFHVNRRTQRFKCYSCGEGGDVIDFLVKYEGKTFTDVVYEQAYALGFIDAEEFATRKQNSNKVEVKPMPRPIVKKVEAKVDTLTQEEIERNHIVYEEYTKLCGLSDKHVQTLMIDRQIKRERLKDYFTLTKEFSKMNELVLACANRGVNVLDIAKVPGFYVESNGEVKASNRLTGIGIKLKDHNSKIRALQIRRDWVGDSDSRYNYISSASKGGSKAYTYSDVIIPQNPTKTLFITEGKFKAEILSNTFNAISISIPGINSWENKLRDAVEHVVKEYNIKHLYVIFDADTAYNLEVYKQCKKMLDTELKDINFKNRFIAYWDMEFGKGVDDLIIQGHKEKLKKLPKEEYIEKYEEMKEYIELNYLEKDKEQMKKLFNKMFL